MIDKRHELFRLEIKLSNDKHDVLIINDRHIHSKFNPLEEAKDFSYTGSNLILIFGLGLCYHVNNIIKNNPDSFFLIFEPIKEIFELQNKYIDDKIYSEYNDKICIFNSIIDIKIINNFLQKCNNLAAKKIITYSNLGYKKLFPDLEVEFYNTVKKNYEIFLQNILTESNFIPLWTKNFLYNSKNLFIKPILKPENKNLNENIAVITCAGPSLLSDIEKIKKHRNKITLFAVDTALKTLLINDINPDFIISLDGQYFSIDDFIKRIPEESILILDIVSYPNIEKLSSNVFYTITENIFQNNIIEYFFKYFNIKKTGLITGGTVSDYALIIAKEFGFKYIFFSGLDLSYPFLQTHCKGTPFFNRSLNLSNYFNSQENIFINAISCRSLKEIKSENKYFYSDFVLQNYLYYLNNFALFYTEINLFYSENNFIEIANFKKIDLENLILKNKTENLVFNKIIEKKDLIFIDIDKLKYFYKILLENIYEKSLQLKKIIEELNLINGDCKESVAFLNSLVIELPFLKKFLLMNEIIYNEDNNKLYKIESVKITGIKLLQTLYYLIRILQKIIKELN